jgi:colanic acid/amylovoran biosynthesis glycosyltransferase
MKQLLDVPLVTTFYGKDISQLPRDKPKWRSRYKTLFEEGDLFLVEGPHLGKQLEEYGCPSRKIKVHHLGVETDRYPFKPRRKEADEPLRVLMAGRFVEKKGFPDGLRAFAEFLERGGRGVMAIIGDANDSKSSQSLKNNLLRIVNERGISENVDFRGLVPHEQLRQAYYDHHVIMSPSREAVSGDNEGGAPVILIEAQATGMPVISTYHCDIPEVVRNGRTGRLVRESDVAGLSDALREFSETGQVREFGKRAGKHVRGEYAASKCGHEKDEIYFNVR